MGVLATIAFFQYLVNIWNLIFWEIYLIIFTEIVQGNRILAMLILLWFCHKLVLFLCAKDNGRLFAIYMSLIAFKGLGFLKLHIGFKIMMFSLFWKHFQWFLMLFSYLKHLHSAYLIQISCFLFPWIDCDRHIILKCAKLIGLV